MENSSDWPDLSTFVKDFATYFKDIPIETLFINRVYLNNEGIELLKQFNVTNEIRFTESRFGNLTPFSMNGFRNLGCKFTSDKKTFNKYIK